MENELTDGRITIRKYRPGDENALYEAVRESIPDISQWGDWAHPAYSLQESAKWVSFSTKLWDIKREYHCCIIENATGKLLGGCGISCIDIKNRVGNVGYWVRSFSKGQGVATAAARLIFQFGFKELHLERLELTISPHNSASRRVAEKAGAIYETTLKSKIRFHDHQHDAMLFYILSGGFSPD